MELAMKRMLWRIGTLVTTRLDATTQLPNLKQQSSLGVMLLDRKPLVRKQSGLVPMGVLIAPLLLGILILIRGAIPTLTRMSA
ncbi:hypothetical protein CCP4SC76_2280010 [Gammaproteobacteria bacterium]